MTTRRIMEPPPMLRVSAKMDPEVRAYLAELDIWLRQTVLDLQKHARQNGSTGGAGSAGAGNQYVPIEVEGTTYRVLHDGTI